MRKQLQSQRSQSSVSIDIHRRTLKGVATEGCRSNSSTFGCESVLHCDIDRSSACVSSLLSWAALELLSLLPWGWIAWQVSAVILACLLWTGQLRRWSWTPVSPLPVRPGGAGAWGSRAAQRGLSLCRAVSPGARSSKPPLHSPPCLHFWLTAIFQLRDMRSSNPLLIKC